MRKFRIDPVRLRDLIEVQELQQYLAAERLGCSVDTVRRQCVRHGIKTQRPGPRGGDRHPDWRGGRVFVGGYWYIYSPDHPHRTKQRRVAEHRLVMEAKLGRYLLPSEVVHHVNGDSTDNSLENLVLFSTNAEHLHHELTGKVPRWTPEGLARIEAGVQRSASRRRLKLGG